MGVGVVVMAYGTPATPDGIEAYYTHIRRGRPPEPHQLAELTARYDALGGTSPLAARTEAQRSAIERALDATAPGHFEVVLGQKHAAPFIEDAVADLAQRGSERIVGVVLAPHFSRASVGEYHARAAAQASERSVPYLGIVDWFALDAHIAFHARSLQNVLEPGKRTAVFFTAHSLPERVLEGDPYADQLLVGAQQIATAAGLEDSERSDVTWGIAWQSAGRTPEPWRGPDILDVIDTVAADGATDTIVIVPHGFTSDHLEVLYDIDIEASARATERGITLRRPPVVNDDADVMAAIAAEIASLAAPLR